MSFLIVFFYPGYFWTLVVAISTQADTSMQSIQYPFDMPSNESALIRKGRKTNLKCNSPCQVIPMIINSKAGFQLIFPIYEFPKGPSARGGPCINLKIEKTLVWKPYQATGQTDSKYFAKTAERYQNYCLKWGVHHWRNWFRLMQRLLFKVK